jgi:hypothetical protein
MRNAEEQMWASKTVWYLMLVAEGRANADTLGKDGRIN